MIEVQNISKSFGDKKVIHNISGAFEKGKTNLIIGASGTGKSVLLKCIVGLIHPDTGTVFYDGRNFTDADKEMKAEVRREIGMLFQGGALFDSKSVEENVMFPLNILTRMSPEEKEERVNFCLKRVGLENVNTKMPSEISGGMKKRVGIARAIVNNPNYLFCDEPNSGLDPQTSILIDELIKEITDEFDITTVVVTHDMNSVMGIGEKILFLFEGRKLWEGTKEEIIYSGVEELDHFVFTNKVMQSLKKK
ncbi:MAG: ATP-binding cassette domain-containing protein [Cyclobacteriaceae bacterium]|nr:ATP-binding cassette domain-containing protein [Cyclobacteriaceae bacterium]MCB9236812.1 ATP-binding cassette domain-containing protein [Flammeovirgaceae bacterium]MCB0498621.1 ATP-binding cassette domain-containing protein [Cyclobacteriaceae bacterium]MCO5271586.1 ATP-binding cassette domain-containing protein [Cyclobacteriaceae bacterium]MCW5901481.1 ATP-binding cassette domain-containing protein [Cyclobacteriaceae bacterium]